MHRFVTRTFLIFVALAAILPLSSRAEEDSELVELYVRASDRGKRVDGLVAANFRITEGGRPRAALAAEPAGSGSIVLLVENSEASWRYLAEVNSAMRGFLRTAPAWHTYSLVSFSDSAKVEAALTPQASRVASAYAGRKQSAWGHVAAYDALDQVLEGLKEIPGLRVVIVVGSGEDAFSRVGFKDLLDRVESTGVVIYSIQLGGSRVGDEPTANEPDLARGRTFLGAVAQRSGGEFYCPNCEAGYRTAVEEILESIETFYKVTYDNEPSPVSGFVKLRVRAFRLDDDVRHDFRVVARPGWRH